MLCNVILTPSLCRSRISPESSSISKRLQGVAACAGRRRPGGPEQAAPGAWQVGSRDRRFLRPPGLRPHACRGPREDRVGAASPLHASHPACPPRPWSPGSRPPPLPTARGLRLPGTPGGTRSGSFMGATRVPCTIPCGFTCWEEKGLPPDAAVAMLVGPGHRCGCGAALHVPSRPLPNNPAAAF